MTISCSLRAVLAKCLPASNPEYEAIGDNSRGVEEEEQ